MAWSKAKTTIVTCAVLLLTAGAGTVVVKHIETQKHKSQFQSHLAKFSMPILKISPNGTVSVIQFPKNGTGSGHSNGHNAGFAFSFKTGDSHEALLRQLDQMHAVILSDTPELLRTEIAKMEMDFNFTDGKMTRVMVIPKAHGTNSVVLGRTSP